MSTLLTKMPRKPLRVGTQTKADEGLSQTQRRERRRRRQSVEDVVGLTPGRAPRGHRSLGEAVAVQDATSAVWPLDQFLEPSSRSTKRKKKKLKSKPAQLPEELPRLEDDSPFLWNAIGAFNTPVPGRKDWFMNFVARTEGGQPKQDQPPEAGEVGWKSLIQRRQGEGDAAGDDKSYDGSPDGGLER